MTQTPRIRTFLWFDGRLEEALDFYASVLGTLQVTEANRDESGSLFTADFEISGHEFIGLNVAGGPTFNDAVSISIECDGQEETDRLWAAFTERGEAGQCGWLVDEFGLSWQVSPRQMRDHLGDPDPERAAYAWQALRTMGKIVLADMVKPEMI